MEPACQSRSHDESKVFHDEDFVCKSFCFLSDCSPLQLNTVSFMAFFVSSFRCAMNFDDVFITCSKVDEHVHCIDCETITVSDKCLSAFTCCTDRRVTLLIWNGSSWEALHTWSTGQVVFTFDTHSHRTLEHL
jgi:hypothetical protein